MHIQKNKKGDAKRILNEAYRATDSKSEYYNKAESKNNIELWNKEKALTKLQHNIDTNKIRNKETVITITSVITKPKDLKPQDERAFWQEVINYHNDKLGKENLIYFVIHKDELNDHAHICYTPIKDNKFQAKHIINKEFLNNYHKELQERLNKKFDYHITIERDEIEKQYDPRLSFNEYKANRKRERLSNKEIERNIVK